MSNEYSHSGPWAERPGFDQNGQVASGFAANEDEPEQAAILSRFYLADLITGYFAAAAMMTALRHRSIEGGSYHVKLSLARSAMWVQELGFLETAPRLQQSDSARRLKDYALWSRHSGMVGVVLRRS